ncbi:CHAT domain-containing protein [Streptoalloteichus hindustanus]|uniref:CHAT domain-containing protein n=1 Tax=Streptoalloteichus hindustanus TaxID=2017 RepID=A0A1M4WAA6_STRHI|nr:CHAT domain-containing tetratricopeptide repeat protein [Streptoalloteichus hindustanus]SHE78174.1 CHAT domain-containing protein [Streptoalloteichus hindustanus]
MPRPRRPAEPVDVLRRVAILRRKARDRASELRATEAVQLIRQALRLLDEVAPPRSAEERLELITSRARVLVTLAYAEAEASTLANGLAAAERAHKLLTELEPGPRRDALDGLVRQQEALILSRAGRLEQAVEAADEAIPLLERGLAGGEGEPVVLVRTLMNRGWMHLTASRIGPARRDLRRSSALAEELGERVVRAKIEHNLGDIAHMIGDVPQALRHYEETERIYQAEHSGMLARLRIDQARALLTAGLGEEAARHLDEALPRLRAQGTAGIDLADAEITRAASALLEGDTEEARRYAGSAYRRLVRRGNRRWAAIAALTRLRAETVEALDGFRAPVRLPGRALQLADRLAELGLTDESAVARMLAVRVRLVRGSVSGAVKVLREVPSPRRITPVDNRMLLRLCRAEVAVARGDSRRALAEAGSGLAELNRLRDRMGGLELLSGTAVHGKELAALAVRLLLEGGERVDARRLFGWLERTRAQVYRYEPLPRIDDPELAERVAEARHLRRATQQARLEGRPTDELEVRYNAVAREVLRRGGRSGQWGRPRPVARFRDVAERLGERAMVSLAASGDSLVAVVVVAGRARLVRLGSARAAAELARELHADLNALAPDKLPDLLARTITGSARHRAQLLDEQLLRPLEGVVGDREVVLVPTGVFYAVPWAALPSLRGRPLSVVPSATAWLAACGGQPAPVEQEDARDAGRAACPPEPDATRCAGQTLDQQGHDVVLVGGPGLPAGVAEVGQLRGTYPNAAMFDAGRATVGAVLSALDGARMAHLAAHGAHEPANALFSRLELIDGPLFAYETARLRRPPAHVVLAACELALNRIRPGDEALGFAGALLASGAHTVVAAVSKVGDLAAASTMASYHGRLARGTPPAVALAEATAEDPLRRPFLCLGAGA